MAAGLGLSHLKALSPLHPGPCPPSPSPSERVRATCRAPLPHPQGLGSQQEVMREQLSPQPHLEILPWPVTQPEVELSGVRCKQGSAPSPPRAVPTLPTRRCSRAVTQSPAPPFPPLWLRGHHS